MKNRSYSLSDLSELAELLSAQPEAREVAKSEDKEGSAEKTYRTVLKTAVVTLVAYMLGMDEDKLYLHYGDNNSELIDSYKKNKEASIIRYLNRLRTTNMLHFKEIDDKILYDFGNIDRISYFNNDEIKLLQKWEVPVVQINYRADRYTEHFCTLIAEYIDDCKNLFPDWINFNYIRELFVVPKHIAENCLENLRACEIY